jgi:thymidylate synthase
MKSISLFMGRLLLTYLNSEWTRSPANFIQHVGSYSLFGDTLTLVDNVAELNNPDWSQIYVYHDGVLPEYLEAMCTVEFEGAHLSLVKYSHQEAQYLQLLHKVLNNGVKKVGRNGETYSLFGEQLVFNLRRGFPLLTTKKMFWRGIVEELLFFIRGDTDTKLLEEKGINIWKKNTSREFLDKCGLDYKEGDMGPMYGFQWRHFNAPYKGADADYSMSGFDQLGKIISEINKNRESRRLVMTDFNPLQLSAGVLYPCHSLILQFYIDGDSIDVKMYQRSADMFLGVPFNIASTSLLLYIIARLTNLEPRYVILTFGDTHIYSLHRDEVCTQLSRLPLKAMSCIKISEKIQSLEDVERSQYSDYELVDYVYHPAIKAEMVA